MNETAAVLALSRLSPLAHAPHVGGAEGRTARWDTAKANLEGKRVQIGAHRILTAGKYGCHPVWTCDFAFASRGLLAMPDHETVRYHLDTLLENRSPEGLVPRALDTVPVGRRVVLGMLQHRLVLPSSKTKSGAPKARLLDEHGTRRGLPGTTAIPDHSTTWLHLPAKLSGLSHHHDAKHWSWLTALSVKVAQQMGDLDEWRRIDDDLGSMAARDGGIGEFYRTTSGDALSHLFCSLPYQSEAPFSWGEGFVLDALKATCD